MEDTPFSFAKQPLHPRLHKRHSSINFTTIPPQHEDVNSIYNKLQKQLQETQMSKKSDLNTDDPALDHDEQIRAPKFTQLARSRSQGIGEMDDSFISSGTNGTTPATSASNSNYGNSRKSSGATFVNHARQDDVEMIDQDQDIAKNKNLHDNNNNNNNNSDTPSPKKVYQPANFAIKPSTSLKDYLVPPLNDPPANGTLEDYNFEFCHANMNATTGTNPLNYISNLEYTTKSPSHGNSRESSTSSVSLSKERHASLPFLKSQRSSNESILSLSKQKYTNLAPIRPLDDPRTPNYKPCVLRTKHDFPTISTSASTSTSTQQTEVNYSPTTISNFEELSNITKSHWVPNHHRSHCHSCAKPFGVINRRHHCRKCGEMFCWNCVNFEHGVKLSYDAQFDLFNGTKAKCCSICSTGWESYLEENRLHHGSVVGGASGAGSGLESGLLLRGLKRENEDSIDPLEVQGKEALSVPPDWTWSSF